MPTFTIKIPGGRIGHFLAGAAVASVIGGTAVAITDTDFSYNPPKIGFYSISPVDLAPRTSKEAAYYLSSSCCTIYQKPDSLGCFNAGIHLPEGAKILSVTSYYQSARTNYHTSVALVRRYQNAAGTAYLIDHNIEDNTGRRSSVRDMVSSGFNLVRNDLYFYSYTFCLSRAPTSAGATDYFFGARIAYQYSTAGD